jgi:hypothetical protein
MVREVTPFVSVSCPEWMDGPVIKALAKKNHWSYEQAKASLQALGHMPSRKLPTEADDGGDEG